MKKSAMVLVKWKITARHLPKKMPQTDDDDC